MAKYKEKIKARELRSKSGISIKEIAKRLLVSKSTVSRWCRDIQLTPLQIEKLEQNAKNGQLRGRLKGARVQKEKKRQRIELAQKEASKKIRGLSNQELFIFGIALYWAEGFKKNGRVGLVNSDPRMIKIFIKWLSVFFDISPDRLRCRIGIHEIHRKRIKTVEKFWSNLTKIPSSQFIKPNFRKSRNKKVYKSCKGYYGTLAISVSRSTNILYYIKGLIDSVTAFSLD